MGLRGRPHPPLLPRAGALRSPRGSAYRTLPLSPASGLQERALGVPNGNVPERRSVIPTVLRTRHSFLAPRGLPKALLSDILGGHNNNSLTSALIF